MIVIILVVNFFFWRPLIAFVERFRVEQSEASAKPKSLVLSFLRRSGWPHTLGRGKRAIAGAGQPGAGRVQRGGRPQPGGHAARRRAADVAFAVVVLLVLAYGLASMLADIGTGSDGLGSWAGPSAWAS